MSKAEPSGSPSGKPAETENAEGSQLSDLIAAWQRERPDADTSAKGIVYAIYLLERGIRRQTERNLRAFDLRYGEYQVLSCLRRQGAPYAMTPGVLADLLELTSGAISQTLQKLETRALIQRRRNDADNRQVTVTLTDQGRALVDDAFDRNTAYENALLRGLTTAERDVLLNGLEQLLTRFRID